MADESGKTLKATFEVDTNLGESNREAKELLKTLKDVDALLGRMREDASNSGGFVGGGRGGRGGGGRRRAGGGGGGGGNDDEDIYKRAAISDWRRRNRVELAADNRETTRQRREELDHERAMRQSYKMRIQDGVRANKERERAATAETRTMEANARRYVLRDIHSQNRVQLLQDRAAERAAEKQARAGSRLGFKTLSMLGAGGIAARIGQAQVYGDLLSTAGYAGLGGMVSRNALGVGVGLAGAGFGIHAAKAWADSGVNSYRDRSQRMISTLESLPLLGYGVDLTKSFSGIRREHAHASQAFASQQQPFISAESRARNMQQDFIIGRDTKVERERAFADYRVVGSPTSDRTTALGKVAYGEEVSRQPGLQAILKAEKELAATRGAVAATTRSATVADKDHAEELQKSKDLQEEALRLKVGDPRRTSLLAESEARAANAGVYAERALALKQQAQHQAEQIPGAERSLREADIADERWKLGNLEQREAFTEQRSVALGSAGVAGRLKGKLALQMIAKNGVDYATPDMLAEARRFAPRTIENLERESGERAVSNDPEWRRLAPADYRDTGAQIREDVSRQRDVVNQADVESEVIFSQREVDARAKEFVKTIFDAIQKIAVTESQKVVSRGYAGAQADATK